MKKTALLIGLLVILAACAPQKDASDLADKLTEKTNTDTDTASSSEQSEPVQTQTSDSQPIQTQPELPSEPTMTETASPTESVNETMETATAEEIIETVVAPSQKRTKMYRFLDTFAKINSYQFKHKGNAYFVRGPIYKVVLDQPVTVKNVQFGDTKKNLYYYDTVYVDKNQKTAVAYCEGYSSQVNQQCGKLELYDLALPVSYSDYAVVLPEDWLYSYLNTEPNYMEDNKYYLKGRATVYVRFDGTPVFELNIDPGSGLVLRVDQKKGNSLITRLDYDDLVTNLVRDVDVRHRSKDEIPSSEAFMR